MDHRTSAATANLKSGEKKAKAAYTRKIETHFRGTTCGRYGRPFSMLQTTSNLTACCFEVTAPKTITYHPLWKYADDTTVVGLIVRKVENEKWVTSISCQCNGHRATWSEHWQIQRADHHLEEKKIQSTPHVYQKGRHGESLKLGVSRFTSTWWLVMGRNSMCCKPKTAVSLFFKHRWKNRSVNQLLVSFHRCSMTRVTASLLGLP